MSGRLETSVVADWDLADGAAVLPDESAIFTVTLAELSAGPLLTTDVAERSPAAAPPAGGVAVRPLPFDVAAARS